MTESAAPNAAPAWRRAAFAFVSIDNVSLLVGLILVTIGAGLFSLRAACLTSGSLILALTLLQSLLDGRRG